LVTITLLDAQRFAAKNVGFSERFPGGLQQRASCIRTQLFMLFKNNRFISESGLKTHIFHIR